MATIGLLFGSFNPPHNGHVGVARAVLERSLADAVWFVVSPQNPFKSAADLAPFDDRVAMTRLAIEGRVGMSVCEVERDLPLPSYTINTIERLRADHPAERFVILAGSDIAEQVGRWHRAEELRGLVDFLFYPRGGGVSSGELSDLKLMDESSTAVREGDRGMVCAAVADYIATRGLYKSVDAPISSPSVSTAGEGEGLDAAGYYDRGRLRYAEGDFGGAMNDFLAARELGSVEAVHQLELLENVLSYRYTDYYNP